MELEQKMEHHLKHALIAVEVGRLELARVFSLFSKLVQNVREEVKLLMKYAQHAAATADMKKLKNYL